MGLELHIPPCIRTPTHPRHPPQFASPLRIQIEGPLTSIQKLFPEVPWNLEDPDFPQPAGPMLARLAYQVIYGRQDRADVTNDLIVRDEYLGWVREERPRRNWIDVSQYFRVIDYYGVTFDHLVPADDPDPEVLQINIFEMDYDEGLPDGIGSAKVLFKEEGHNRSFKSE
ncbi:hypothetical protein X797_011835 [Metarhizium robertsii]|uniref:Uncharacterized protein n=2 Tax=Metarhizium robertsii TaxID=568076 RepID=E9FCM2_METRA|nr:uncharacterized protein MAA_10021 [Metarhizium robertsii ARSEF 23]EFY94529.1 hypothetical protein MAA_10021 [Metarhizium robertsii ARSEF 23]EXU95076.1 hypothetical protein X797_011835 [Metarhizium robertsii]